MKLNKISLCAVLAMMILSLGGCAESENTDNISVSESTDLTSGEKTYKESESTSQTTTELTSESVSEETENDSKNNETPFEKHGKLSVNGADLVDSSGEKYQLYGMSTHGLAWFPQYVNEESFKTLRDEWNTNCVRLAMYTYESGGYCSDGDKEELKNLVKSGVDYATNLGMYVIIDWHVLNDKDPNVYKDEAIEFFKEMSELYKDNDNVIYEICNEPNTTAQWSDIKSYAEEVIPVIKANDSDAVIIVGTPTWSQDIDKALADPLDFDNVMYALHFYADEHTDWLRERVTSCVDSGLPVFVSEFNITDASGNANVNTEQGDLWMELINKYNLSYICWNLSASGQACSVISQNDSDLSGWEKSDLSETGQWVYDNFVSEDNK